jgi:ribosome-associated protein
VTPEELKERIPASEFTFLTSRSSGPGGQNVNKVNTKVEVRFNFRLSAGLSEAEKDLISKKLKTRINATGELVVKSQSERSQLRNRKNAIEKVYLIISYALTEKPERKPTAPTKKSQQERLNEKHKISLKKKLRKDTDEA